MSLKIKNRKTISNYILNQSVLIEKALIYYLEVMVAELENHAKESAGYKDRTSNLKSSIGGVVLKDGNPVTFRGFSGTSEGSKVGENYLNSLLDNYSNGYTVLIVAGMEYASPLENYLGYNVLKKTELKMQTELPKVMRRLKKAIDKAA